MECESKLQVEAYLEVYPAGVYVAEARACLEGQLGLDRGARRLVQQGLTSLDYSVGAADGLFGPATRRAIRTWQQGKGFAATGYLTQEQADTLMAQGREAVAARAQESPSRISPDQTCEGQSEGAVCWIELTNQAGCYVWNGSLAKDETVTWTGGGAEGLAHGEGALTWVWGEDKKVTTSTGRLQDGQPHGYWVEHYANGNVYEGPYVDGKRHGRWVKRLASGDIHEGLYVEGKMHGRWIQREADGDVWEGPFVNGQLHGRWVVRRANGRVSERTYVNGERQ